MKDLKLNTDPNSRIAPVKPVAPYLGGKSRLAKQIVQKINSVPHSTYAEVFVGMGGVFLRRDHQAKCEVINDRNRDVYNLFRILQEHYPYFIDLLKWRLTTRVEFERLITIDPDTLTDLQRAARFLYLQRTAFGGQDIRQELWCITRTIWTFRCHQAGPNARRPSFPVGRCNA